MTGPLWVFAWLVERLDRPARQLAERRAEAQEQLARAACRTQTSVQGVVRNAPQCAIRRSR